MVVTVSTPCLAAIKPDGFVSIDGTAWRADRPEDEVYLIVHDYY
jgi:hypothetical protein